MGKEGFRVVWVETERRRFVFRIAASGSVGDEHSRDSRTAIARSLTSSSCLQYVMEMQVGDLLKTA